MGLEHWPCEERLGGGWTCSAQGRDGFREGMDLTEAPRDPADIIEEMAQDRRTRDNWPKLTEESQPVARFLHEDSLAVAQVAQRGCPVSILRDFSSTNWMKP